MLLCEKLGAFYKKQGRYVEWISESIDFLRLVYRKKKFTHIDQLTYKVEREALLKLLSKLDQLHIKYEDVLQKFPDVLGQDMIQEAVRVLESAPRILKVCCVVPVLMNTVDNVERAVKVNGPVVTVVNSHDSEKLSNVVVKEPKKLFVVPKLNVLEAQKIECIAPCQIESVESKVEKILHVFINEKPKTFTNVCFEIVFNGLNEKSIQPSITQSHETCLQELNIEKAVTGNKLVKVFKLNISFLRFKFYDRVSLRMFWFYFLFADFSFVIFFVSSGSSFLFFALFLFVGKVSLFVVKIGILTVGSVNAVWALDFMFVLYSLIV